MWLILALPGWACLVLALIAGVGQTGLVVWVLSAPDGGGLNPLQTVIVMVYGILSLALILIGPSALWSALRRAVRRG